MRTLIILCLFTFIGNVYVNGQNQTPNHGCGIDFMNRELTKSSPNHQKISKKNELFQDRFIEKLNSSCKCDFLIKQ